MPTFDEISVELSKRAGDPVAAATTNGARFTASQRSACINEAIRRFLVKAAKSQNEDALQGYLAREAQSLTANVKALSGWTGEVAWILDAYNATDSLPIKHLPQRYESLTETGGNQYLTASATNQFWTIDGSNFRLIDGVANSTDSIRLRYVKKHTDLAAGSSVTVINDASFNITNSSLTVTNFTGTLVTHVGGTLVGTDNGGNFFSRIITDYVSSTSFKIASTVTAEGACTNGYIIPLGSTLLVPSQYHPQLIDLSLMVLKEIEGTSEAFAQSQVLEQGVARDIG